VTLVLASASPRRSALLTQLGVPHEIAVGDVDETVLPDEAPDVLVVRLARLKAQHVASMRGAHTLPVLGADTVVAVDGRILGKPRNAEEAFTMLALLSGRSHRVLSGVALVRGDDIQSRLSVSVVTFRSLGRDEIASYWASGEPHDKAGAYAVQGLAARFIARLEGSYSGVMGLPLFETAELLATAGLLPSLAAPATGERR
jgi:septum formation protein